MVSSNNGNDSVVVHQPHWFWRLPAWLITLVIHLVALGLLALLVANNEEAVSQIHGLRSKDLPVITSDEAAKQLKDTGSLSNVRVEGRIFLEDVVIDGRGEFILQNVHFENDVFINQLKASVVRLIDCTFANYADLDLSQIDGIVTLWDCSFSSELFLTGLTDETSVILNFKQPPTFIGTDSRAAAERLQLHAPQVPLSWPAYSKAPVRDQSGQIME